MLRDLDRLRAAAALVAADLNRTIGDGWRCVVSDDYILTVAGPKGQESAALSAEDEDEAWYVRPEFSPTDQAEALEADAQEVVACEVLEVLRVLELAGPRCPIHGSPVDACSGVWLCPEHGHDLEPVGLLGTG